MTILSSSNVTKRFGGLVAVDQFDLDLQELAIHSIIGPNGAGKTTFFNCVTGVYSPEEGDISFNEKSLKGLQPDRIAHLGIARTYQNIRLFSNMTAIENILVGQHSRLKASPIDAILHTPRYHKEEEEAHEEANRLIRFVGLTGLGDHLARTASRGLRQTQHPPAQVGLFLANLTPPVLGQVAFSYFFPFCNSRRGRLESSTGEVLIRIKDS